MSDERERRLAQLLVDYSVDLHKGERCLINAVDVPSSMVEELIAAVYRKSGYPEVNYTSITIERALIEGGNAESFASLADSDSYRMDRMDAFIGIRGVINPKEMSGLSSTMSDYLTYYNTPVHHDRRVANTKWVVLRYPTFLMASQAGMPMRQFTDSFYSMILDVDYPGMSASMDPAVAFMNRAKDVHVVAEGTDLRMSIEGLPAIKCAGRRNIPDGEIYTAPVRDSVQGVITYNTLSTYEGTTFNDVRFVIRDGKIVEATANNTRRLNEILDTDTGSRYFGEFALGCNPRITSPMDNTLFDEKIAGSIHFTPGNAYTTCDNGNRSGIHWDLVQIQRPEYGGGKIYMDGALIRKDGVFVHEAFRALN